MLSGVSAFRSNWTNCVYCNGKEIQRTGKYTTDAVMIYNAPPIPYGPRRARSAGDPIRLRVDDIHARNVRDDIPSLRLG